MANTDLSPGKGRLGLSTPDLICAWGNFRKLYAARLRCVKRIQCAIGRVTIMPELGCALIKGRVVPRREGGRRLGLIQVRIGVNSATRAS
jgi:hypothetical protein